MAEIIPFSSSSSTWNEKLAAFAVSQNPLDYLDALDIALETKACLDIFHESRARFFDACGNAEWFAVFSRACRILARVNWASVDPASSQLPTPAPSSKFLAALEALNAVLARQKSEHRELGAKAAAKGMGEFPPGFRFVDAFDSLFGNDSPLDYINKAVGILSPKQTFSHSEDCWFSGENSLRPNEQQLEFLVSEIVAPLMALANQAQETNNEFPSEEASLLKREMLATIAPVLTQFFLEDLADFSEKLRGQATLTGDATHDSPFGSYDGFLAYVLKPGKLPIPQGLVMALVRKILDTGFDPGARNEELAARAGLHLMSWPIGTPAEHWTDINNGLLEPETMTGLQACYEKPVDVPFLPCRLLTTPLYPIYGSNLDFSDWLGGRLYSEAMQNYSDKLSRFSARRLDGKFPWEPWESNVNWYFYPYGHSSSWNLLLQFQVLKEELNICDTGDYFSSDDYGDDEVDGFTGFNLYRNFWLAAEKEGLAKLGNAVFAFYLVRKTISSLNRGAPEYDWPAFVEHLDRCRENPGAHWIEKALAITKQASGKSRWEMVWLRHDNLRGIGASPVELTSSTKATSDAVIDLGMEAEQELAKKYGALFYRLHERSRRMLCKAEANYRRHSKSLGLHAGEYGTEAIDYAKCFENELDRRLKAFYLDEQVQLYMSRKIRGWRNNGEPTLGTYIMFLERSNEMPEDLQVLIQTKIGTLSENQGLLGQLRKLQSIRNRGAHPGDDVSASKFTELRELIHSGGLLEDFLKAIPEAS